MLGERTPKGGRYFLHQPPRVVVVTTNKHRGGAVGRRRVCKATFFFPTSWVSSTSWVGCEKPRAPGGRVAVANRSRSPEFFNVLHLLKGPRNWAVAFVSRSAYILRRATREWLQQG